jgi:AraC-like DNA-binding protein
MMKIGQKNSGRKNVPFNLGKARYCPPSSYAFDLEIFPATEVKHRANDYCFTHVHRIDYYLLLFVMSGQCRHILDFKSIQCVPGCFITLHPNQIHQFDAINAWDGWIVIFRPEFLLPLMEIKSNPDMQIATELHSLPEQVLLNEAQTHTVNAIFTQMHEDAQSHAHGSSIECVHGLLRHQLYVLLHRVHFAHTLREVRIGVRSSDVKRFKMFKQLVEKNFSKWHQVSDYACSIGCSEKSLTRTAVAIAGTSAKTYIASRINLEAKRLLKHTTMPIYQISEHIGFDEPTNFVKFFKREVGTTPGEFRQQQARQGNTHSDIFTVAEG